MLGDTLQRQRTEAVESTALLTSVMGAIDVAVFALDMDGTLVLVNPAAERLVGQPSAKLLGRDAQQLRLAAYLVGETPRLINRPFGPESGRLELRRSTFRRDGKPHQLLVFADLSRALREEEQQAWQRIVRVLSHEINNSLTPIKSIAHSIKRMLSRVPDLPRAEEIQDGLNLIETRSGSLGRFLRAYAQLARLPKPQQRPIQIAPIAHRIAGTQRTGSPSAWPVRPTSRSQPMSGSDRTAADQHRPQRRRCDARDQRPSLDRLEDGRWIAASHGRRRGSRATGHVEPLRSVFHHEAGGIGHRPGAEPADRRGARRHAGARESHRVERLPARCCACRCKEEEGRSQKEEGRTQKPEPPSPRAPVRCYLSRNASHSQVRQALCGGLPNSPGRRRYPVRAFKSVGATPIFIERARGATIEDADGNSYIDYVMSWGPLLHGHAPKGS